MRQCPDFGTRLCGNRHVLPVEGQNPGKAQDLLEKAVRMNITNATAHYELGRTMQKLGNDRDAELNLKEAFVQDTTYTSAYYILSTLARKKGDRVAATNYLAELHSLTSQEKKNGISAQVLSMRHR
jgi:predicted Zn-dependent protease